MKKITIILLSIFLFSTHAQANDPYEDRYDDAQENQGQWSDNEKYLDGYEDAQRNKQHTTINGEWDTQGDHYTPAGGGNKWRQDGTFMQKAAGGYIDTKTGQFIPSN